MGTNQGHMIQISELEAAYLALEKENQALKQAQATLSETENKFRTIVEQAAEGILVLQEGQRKYYNSAWLEIIGYSSEEYDPIPFLSFVHPEDVERIEETYQLLASGSLFEQIPDFRIFTKSGEVKWLSIRSANIQWEGKPAELIFFQDITRRKQAEDALTKNEVHLQRAQEVAHVGSWELDLIRGGLFWSDETYRIFGLHSETLMDYETFLTCVMPEDRDNVNKKWQAALTGAAYDVEHRICVGDGVKWVREKAEVEFDRAGRAIRGIGIVMDITERKRVEHELRESEERFRATFEQASVGIAHVSLDGRFLRLNQKFCDIVGYSPAEMQNFTFQDITHLDDLDADLEYVEKLLSGQLATYSMEKRYFKKEGKIVWVNLTGSLLRTAAGVPVYFIAVIEDISNRKEIEQALFESELKYRTVVEQASEGIMVMQDYEVKYYNSTFREMTGYSDEEYASISFMGLVHPDDVEVIEETYQAIMSKQEVDDTEFKIITKSGDTKWLSIHGTYIEWEDRPAVMVFADDVTVHKQQEWHIQSYQRHLQALASQLTLTEEQERRRIAVELHDHVGQALALARIQIAAAQNPQPEAARNALLGETSKILKEAIQETRSLVFDLSSPLLNELGLSAAISEWLQEHAERQAGLKTELIEIGPDLPMSADLRAILFRNVRELLTNVIRHAQATCVSVTLEQTPTQACVTVQDDGIGFQANKISSQLTRSSGFGLFSIQEQMKDLGGSLTIHTAPGEGANITLCVPIQVK